MTTNPTTHRIVVMGVAGSGKTTVGQALAERLDARFVDGDDLHPPENVAKMSAGEPLDDLIVQAQVQDGFTFRQGWCKRRRRRTVESYYVGPCSRCNVHQA